MLKIIFLVSFGAVLLPVLLALNSSETNLSILEKESDSEKPHSRKRRYVAFPEGSSIAASLCTTIGGIGNPYLDFISYALNWGVAYDLPNETWTVQNAHGYKYKAVPPSADEIKRRDRRELYHHIEVIMDSMGFNGRHCVLRALCEVSQCFGEEKGTMMMELVKTIFRFPTSGILSREHRDVRQYRSAYRKGLKNIDCASTYYGCHISLLELAMGFYSRPPPPYMDNPNFKEFM